MPAVKRRKNRTYEVEETMERRGRKYKYEEKHLDEKRHCKERNIQKGAKCVKTENSTQKQLGKNILHLINDIVVIKR